MNVYVLESVCVIVRTPGGCGGLGALVSAGQREGTKRASTVRAAEGWLSVGFGVKKAFLGRVH